MFIHHLKRSMGVLLLNESQIIQGIKLYLNDKLYNYAVLIDGEWGCGKTYFVKNTLRRELIDQSIKYISLYGCKSIEEIKEKIIFSVFLNKDKNEIKKIESITNGGKAICDVIKDKISIIPNISITSFCWDWIDFSKSIYIFDDLERCDCPLNVVFGLINEIVEHHSAKVIIVANEKEISYEVQPDNLEQQYMVVLRDDVDWPKYERKSNFFSIAYYDGNNSQKVSIEELDFRRKKLFPIQESNIDYRKVREKLIGVTFKYESDIESITKEILKSANYPEQVEQAVVRNYSTLKRKMDYYNHHNLRTIQFFLSKVSFLLSELNRISVDSDYIEKTQNYVISECFDYAVKLKSNYNKVDDNLGYMTFPQKEPCSKTIREFVKNGQFIFDDYMIDIEDVNRIYKSFIDRDDPYSQLSEDYYNLKQTECEEKLNEMLSRLKENKYPMDLYERMLILLAKLEDIGFSEDISQKCIDVMIHNMRIAGETTDILLESPLEHISEKGIAERVKAYISLMDRGIGINAEDKNKKDITAILSKDNWVELLNEYIQDLGDIYTRDIAVFSLAKSDLWVDAIESSSSRTIHDFRSWMWRVYPQNIKKESFYIDWPILEEILKKINLSKEEDLIKRKALDYVIWQIKETYKINIGKEYKEDNCLDESIS